MATLTDEQLSALRFLAGRPSGCTEAMLLAQGFTTSSATSSMRDLPSYEQERAPREGVPSEDHRGEAESGRGVIVLLEIRSHVKG